MWSDVEAEQALLGAVLADPPGQQYLLGLVEPGDMFRPWHGQVLAAMQRLRGRGQIPSPQNVYQEIRHDPDLPRSVALDAVPLAGLLGSLLARRTPERMRPSSWRAGSAGAFELAGSRVAQAAEDGDLDVALGQAARARAGLVACAARWTALPATLRSEPARLTTGEPWLPGREDTGRTAAPSHANPPVAPNAVHRHPASPRGGPAGGDRHDPRQLPGPAAGAGRGQRRPVIRPRGLGGIWRSAAGPDR